MTSARPRLTARLLLAFCAAAAAAGVPLLPFFALPASPWYLGRLVPDSGITPWFAAGAVLLDAALLGYCMIVVFAGPVYFCFAHYGLVRPGVLCTLGASCGAAAACAVALFQQFGQAPLAEFASSPLSLFLGTLSGLFAACVLLLIRGNGEAAAAACEAPRR